MRGNPKDIASTQALGKFSQRGVQRLYEHAAETISDVIALVYRESESDVLSLWEFYSGLLHRQDSSFPQTQIEC